MYLNPQHWFGVEAPLADWGFLADVCVQEIKLQEAIFELFNGEEDLVEDLKLVRKTYADSLIHLNILKPEEEKLGRSSPSTHFICFIMIFEWLFVELLVALEKTVAVHRRICEDIIIILWIVVVPEYWSGRIRNWFLVPDSELFCSGSSKHKNADKLKFTSDF